MGAKRARARLIVFFLGCAAALWLAVACGASPDPCWEDRHREYTSMEEGNMVKRPEITRERRHEIRLKYDPLFWRQPNVFGVSEGLFQDENGEWTETVGIKVKVTKKVDQSTLPPEDRIPECLEGVPVQIREYGEDERPDLFSPQPEDPEREEDNGSD